MADLEFPDEFAEFEDGFLGEKTLKTPDSWQTEVPDGCDAEVVVEESASASGSGGSSEKSTEEGQEGSSPRTFVSHASQGDLMKRFGHLLPNSMKATRSDAGGADATSPVTVPGGGAASPPERRQGIKAPPQKEYPGENTRINVMDGGHLPCFVCGILYAAMPDGSIFCYRHRRVTDTMRKRWAPPPKNTKPENMPTQEVLDDKAKKLAIYKTYLKAKKLPPSDFSRLVYAYMQECPENMYGQRAEFQIMAFHELLTRTTLCRKGFKLVKMHKAKYLKHLETEQPCTTPEQHLQMWENLLLTTPLESEFEDGPEGQETRIEVLAEDFTIGERVVAHAKLLDLSSKPKSIKDGSDLDGAREKLVHGELAFDNHVFNDAGGGRNLQATVGAKRALGFAADTLAQPETQIGTAVVPAKEAKKPKVYQVDTQRARLGTHMTNKLEDLLKLFEIAESKRQNASSLQEACQGKEIPGLGEYMAILNRRCRWLAMMKITGHREDQGIDASVLTDPPTVDDQTIAVSSAYRLAVRLEKDTKDETATASVQEKLKIFIDGVKMIQDLQSCFRFKLMLRHFKCNSLEDFKVGEGSSSVAELREGVLKLKMLLSLLAAATKAECYLAKTIVACLESREPLPEASMCVTNVSSVASIEFDIRTASVLANEDEVTHCKKAFDHVTQMMSSVANRVSSGAKDVSSLVEKHTTKAVEKQEKQMQKELEKEQRAAQKKDEQEAKRKAAEAKLKAGKRQRVVPAKPVVASMPKAPQILEAVAKCNKVHVFENQEAYEKGKDAFFTENIARPHVVKAPERVKTICSEGTVKCSMGVYKVQIPTQNSFKTAGRSNVPFQNERKERIIEALKSYTPDITLDVPGFKAPFVQATNQLGIFLCSHCMTHAGIERNCLGNVRYQAGGSRQILVITMAGVKKAAGLHSLTPSAGEEMADFGRRVCEAMVAKDLDDEDFNKEVYYVQLDEEEVMAIPPGCFTIERTLPPNPPSDGVWTESAKKVAMVIGVRTHYLTGKDTQSFANFKSAVKVQAEQSIPEDRILKYWQHIQSNIEAV